MIPVSVSLSILSRGGFRHVQHVRPNRGPHKKGAPTKGQKIIRYAYKYYSNTPSLAYSLLQKGWPQTASQLLLQ